MYSFGVLLWEMICGRRAWGGLNNFQIVYALTMNNEALQLPGSIPQGISSLAQKCLDHQPQQRCTVQEAVALLDAQLAKL